MDMKRKRGVRRVMTVAICAALGLSCAFLPGKAFAGTMRTELAGELFDENGINAAQWTLTENGDGKISVNDERGVIRFENATTGTRLLAKNKTSGAGAIVEYELVSDANTGAAWMTVMAGYPEVANPGAGGKNFPLLQPSRLLDSAKGAIFLKPDGAAVDGGWLVIPYENARFRFTYAADGGLKIETAAKGADGTYGDYAVLATAPAGSYDVAAAGYAGIAFDGGRTCELDNVKVMNLDGSTVAEADFETDAWKEQFQLAAGNGAKVKAGKVKSVKFQDVADGQNMTTVKSYEVDPLLTNTLDVAFSVRIDSLENARFGLKFLGGETTAMLYVRDDGTNSYLGFLSGEAEVPPAGAAEGVKEEKLAKRVVGTEEYFRLEISASSGGTVVVNGTTKFETGRDLSGKLALGALNGGEEHALLAYLSAFTAGYYNYRGEDGKDVANNFNTGYLNEEDWYLASVSMPGMDGSLSLKDGALVFDRAGDGSLFGPTGKYCDFMLEFDLTDIVREAEEDDDGNIIRPASTWLGIVFGKENLGDLWGESNRMVYFQAGTVDSINLTSEAGSSRVWDTENMWALSNAGKVYNMRVTLQNRTLTVSRKAASEPYDAYREIAKFVDVDAAGYVTFAVTAGASMTLDNVRFTNLDAGKGILDEARPAEPEDPEEPAPPPSGSPSPCPSVQPETRPSIVLPVVLTGIGALIVGAAGMFLAMKFLFKKKS